MPRKHYCYTRSIFYGIGEGGGAGVGGVGGGVGDVKAITRTASAVNNSKNYQKKNPNEVKRHYHPKMIRPKSQRNN